MRPALWHKESWETLMEELLPNLLSDQVDINSYSRETGSESDAVSLSLTGQNNKHIEVSYKDIPASSSEGVFLFDGREVVVVPIAENEELASVECCGDQMLKFLEQRISRPPSNFFTDEESVKAWLPLTDWFREFFLISAQVVDDQNFVSRQTHLNRIIVDEVKEYAIDSQVGRVCVLETPEGPNISRVLTVARGATISRGSVVIKDTAQDAGLGLSASLIPFLEHSNPARLLMGANMIRQWIPPLSPERPLVRTGLEPELPEIWCGYNLITAFTSVGSLNCEDSLVISESARQRMRYETPLEIGDKLSNRSGDKGVVGAIWPDNKMPKLTDGTSVELIIGLSGLHTRMNCGTLFEAVAGRIADQTGEAFIARPFQSPSRAELQDQLIKNGLSSDGMEFLEFPGQNRPPKYRALVGWVYWGRTRHNVADKLFTIVEASSEKQRRQRWGEMEYWILRDAELYHVINENTGLRSDQSPTAESLTGLISGGESFPSNFPSTPLLRLQRKLESAGVGFTIDDKGLTFSWCEEGNFTFCEPIRHPWSSAKLTTKLTPDTNNPAWANVEKENAKLESLKLSGAPESLLERTKIRLEQIFSEYVDTILTGIPSDLTPTGWILFSLRSVVVPSTTLDANIVGIPDEAAWTIFGPLLARTVGNTEVEKRTQKAEKQLDLLLGNKHVILWRAPSVEMTSAIAVRPTRISHNAIEMNPLICKWLHADFDGDQVGIYLPLSEEAQQDAAEKLSIVGHLKRDPKLIYTLVPPHEAVWGLSLLWLNPEGRRAVVDIAGEIKTHGELLTQWELVNHVEGIMKDQGPEVALSILEKLMQLGFQSASESGASMNPFAEIDATLDSEEGGHEYFESSKDYKSELWGPQLIFAKGNIRGSVDSLVKLHFKRHKTDRNSNLSGLPYKEFMDLALTDRKILAEFLHRWQNSGSDMEEAKLSKATTLLARARRAKNPGVVFASAATRNETDPLKDRDARLFAGLTPY